MIRIRDIALPPAHSAEQLQYEAAQLLRLSPSRIRKLTIVRRSVDARKKPDVKKVTGKPITAGGDELQDNPRARSAKLRIIEKRQTI